MAKIKFGMMMTDARGKLGGQVFSKNRSGAYVRTKVTPTNPQSAFQSAVRALFALISASWSTLTAAQRASWNGAVSDWATTDVFGDLKNPSGKNLHQRLNQNLGNTGQTLINTAPAKVTLPEDVITAAPIGIAATSLALTGASTSADVVVQVFATPPLSQGTTFVKNRLRQIYFEVGDSYSATDAYAAYVAKFGAPTAGDNIFVAARYVGPNGQASPLQTVKSVVSA
jgi:hypothetical protein